jgi:hypothetical protein
MIMRTYNEGLDSVCWVLESYDSRLLFRATGNGISTETCYPDAGIVYELSSLFINVSC